MCYINFSGCYYYNLVPQFMSHMVTLPNLTEFYNFICKTESMILLHGIFTRYANSLAMHLSGTPHILFFFFILTRGHFSIFCSDRAGGRERKREREKHRYEGTHRVAATRTTNQGRGQTATKVHALSGNRTRVSPDRRLTLQPLSQTGQGTFF
uniref:Uncharacterized protein n=1 Tax=Molossus molossus TaxID=27622 RepID=A0A7J8DPR0_MOLMO|nr:hypothetical protein HJG59_009236 [Molossus molossus]